MWRWGCSRLELNQIKKKTGKKKRVKGNEYQNPITINAEIKHECLCPRTVTYICIYLCLHIFISISKLCLFSYMCDFYPPSGCQYFYLSQDKFRHILYFSLIYSWWVVSSILTWFPILVVICYGQCHRLHWYVGHVCQVMDEGSIRAGFYFLSHCPCNSEVDG